MSLAGPSGGGIVMRMKKERNVAVSVCRRDGETARQEGMVLYLGRNEERTRSVMPEKHRMSIIGEESAELSTGRLQEGR